VNLTRRLTLADQALWIRLGLVQRFARANKGLIAYLVIVAVVAFGYDLAGFSLKTDAELHAVDPGAKLTWIQQGRWAMYLLNTSLLPDPVMPVVPVMVALLGLACGVLFFLLSLSEQRTSSDYLAAPLVLVCPLLAYSFYFTTLNYGLGVALALVGAGHYAMTRWRWSSAALAASCFAIAIGIYQVTLLLIPAMFGFYIVAQVVSVPRLDTALLLRRFCVFCAVTLAACGMYEAMKVAMLHAYDVAYAQEYMQGYLTWTADPTYWSTAIRKTIVAGRAYYTGGDGYYLYKLRIVAVLFWIVLVLMVVRLLVAPQSTAVKVIGVLALVGSLCAPLLMHLANGGHMPPRTALGVPFVLGGLVFCVTLHGDRRVNLVLGMLVVACFFKFAVVNNRYAFANELTWKADQDLSLLILQRIHSQWHKLPQRGAPYPVVLVGMLEARESPLYVQRDLIGSSFYHSNEGNVGRVVSLWRSMRHFDFRHASNPEAIGVAGRAIAMPVWPAEGSVDVIDGVIVVKIGDFTLSQILTLCEHAPTSDFCERDARQLLTVAGNTGGKAAIYQGLWWNSPAGAEEGWGLELAQKGDLVFVSWFTYDLAGRNWWLVMPAQRQKSNVYAGPLIEMRGPSLAAAAFNPAHVVSKPVGNGTLTFTDPNNATLDFTVEGIRQTKSITRAMPGTTPACSPDWLVNLAKTPNYQGLWGAAPAGSESGWGLSLNQYRDTLLGTWFTYDLDGAPLWLSLTAQKTRTASYSGELHKRTGARFDAFDSGAVRSTRVGTATLDFDDADNATFAFIVDGIGQGRVARTKAIVREIAGSAALPCRRASASGVRSGDAVETNSIQPSR
jgi:hypothetical protein